MGHRKPKKPSPSKRRSPPTKSKSRSKVSTSPVPVPTSPAPAVELTELNSEPCLTSPAEVHNETRSSSSKSSDLSPAPQTNLSEADVIAESTADPKATSQIAAAEVAAGKLVPLESGVKDLSTAKSSSPLVELAKEDNTWSSLVKGTSKQLQKKGESFTLESGEACVKIPNSVIEKNRTSWELFVLGQFYSEPPSQGTLHNIVNGIWSKQHRDISVSKMEGYSFLFRIPNRATRARVTNTLTKSKDLIFLRVYRSLQSSMKHCFVCSNLLCISARFWKRLLAKMRTRLPRNCDKGGS